MEKINPLTKVISENKEEKKFDTYPNKEATGFKMI